jgi:WD40 repeat protein
VSLQEQPVWDTTCLGIPALSPNRQWLACLSADGSQSALSVCRSVCQGTSVSLMAAQDLPNPRPVTIIGARPADAAAGANTYISPIWSPDGRYLAVVRSPAHEPGCLIDIYAFDPARATFALTSALNTDIAGGDFCEIHQIAWSPASPTLALVHQVWKPDGTSTTGIALLRIPSAALVTSRGAHTFSVATVSLRTALAAPTQVMWTPSGQALLIDDGGKALDQIAIAAGRQSTIFSIPSNISNPPELLAMAQAANGASLLLALGYTKDFTAQITGRQPQPARALIPVPASCLPYPGLPAAIYQYSPA